MIEEKFDKGCPYAEFELWDASVSLDFRHGDYECITETRGFQPSLPGEDKWRYVCDCKDHNNCYYFKKENKLEKEIEK